MRKSRFLVLALVVAVMMMGAGYAAWTETVTINNNVCTGELDVDLAAGTVAVFSDTAGAVEPAGITRTAEAVLDAGDTENNTATVTVDNLYPGAFVTISVPISNVGTIPAKLDAITNTFASTWATLSAPTAPADIAVGGSGSIVYELTVGDTAPENGNLTFDVVANYKQFNQ